MAIKASNQVSLLDVTDAYSVTLTSEAFTFIGNTSGAPSGLSCTTQVVAYCGSTQCTKVTIGTVSCPTGISATISNNGGSSPTITFKTTATVTTACEATIPVTVDSVTINKKFSFAVAKQGSTGSTGSTGPQGPKGDKGDTGATGAKGDPGIDFSQGKMLFDDPMFANGINSVSVYNNSSGGNVTHSRSSKSSDNPMTGTSYELVIKNKGSASPGIGGFTWGHASRANAIFVYRIVAKIPSGRTIRFASNAIGNNAKQQWLTSQSGTGKFTEYIFRLECGGSGSFSSTGYFYIDGSAGSASSPITWYVAYATCYDMTNVSDVKTAQSTANTARNEAAAAAKTATNFMSYDSTNGLLIGNKTGGSFSGTRAQITSSAFNILNSSGKQLASYGTEAVIGDTSGRNVKVNSGGFNVYDGSALIGQIGYGDGLDSDGNTTTSPYYTLGLRKSGSAVGGLSVAEGYNTTASAWASHAEGYSTTASGCDSHAEGTGTTASGNDSHAEGTSTTASGNESHAEGYLTTASETRSHAEGDSTTASGWSSHAEGYSTTASGPNSHAEGYSTTASGYCAHAEGCSTTASGSRSHAEGHGTTASGDYSHASGLFSKANGEAQTVIGRNNVSDTTSAFIIGNGASTISRSNAMTVDFGGNMTLAGGITATAMSFQNPATNNKWAVAPAGFSFYHYEGHDVSTYKIPNSYVDVLVFKTSPQRGIALAVDWRNGAGQPLYVNTLHDDSGNNNWYGWRVV